MITVKAVFENGNIKLLEDIQLKEQQPLLVTVTDENKTADSIARNISLQQPESFNEYLADKREDLYQDYLNTSR